MRIASIRAWYTLEDFGITDIFKHIGYKGGNIPQYMLKSNGYINKQLWYNKKLYICLVSTSNTVTININNKLIKVNRRDIFAPKNTIPVYKQKTTQELLTEIKLTYPDAKLHIPKVGCQLHGDIDAILTIDQEEYIIPWNY